MWGRGGPPSGAEAPRGGSPARQPAQRALLLGEGVGMKTTRGFGGTLTREKNTLRFKMVNLFQLTQPILGLFTVGSDPSLPLKKTTISNTPSGEIGTTVLILLVVRELMSFPPVLAK